MKGACMARAPLHEPRVARCVRLVRRRRKYQWREGDSAAGHDQVDVAMDFDRGVHHQDVVMNRVLPFAAARRTQRDRARAEHAGGGALGADNLSQWSGSHRPRVRARYAP